MLSIRTRLERLERASRARSSDHERVAIARLLYGPGPALDRLKASPTDRATIETFRLDLLLADTDRLAKTDSILLVRVEFARIRARAHPRRPWSGSLAIYPLSIGTDGADLCCRWMTIGPPIKPTATTMLPQGLYLALQGHKHAAVRSDGLTTQTRLFSDPSWK